MAYELPELPYAYDGISTNYRWRDNALTPR